MIKSLPVSPGTIGIVTVTFNSAYVLADFCDSLAKQSLKDFVLYVVDNDSSDGTLDLLSQYCTFPTVVIANKDNRGVAEANNQGIRMALAHGCQRVLLLNNDTVFGANLLRELRSGQDHNNCSMITPKIYYHDCPTMIWAAGGCFQKRFGAIRPRHYGERAIDKGQFDQLRKITYAPTCCLLIHRAVFDRIGLMDPLYFVYWDDVDFLYRALKAGLTVFYLPTCVLWHKVSSLTQAAGKPWMVRYGIRNRIYFMRKHFSPLSTHLWLAGYKIYLWLRMLSGMDTKPDWKWKCEAISEGLRME